MMHRGYTIRWRKRWDKGYHQDHLLWVMMDWFIDHANYEDGEKYMLGYGIVKLKRGQHVFGTPSMAKYFNASEKRIRNRLAILEKTEFMAIKRGYRFSIATIINYNKYQDKENLKGKLKGKQREDRGKIEGTQGATHNTYNTYKALSKNIIIYLNVVSGRDFKPESNAKYVIPRLKEGHTEEDCKKVIEAKWKDPDFDNKYFRPETLFRPSKFEGYLNEGIGATSDDRFTRIREKLEADGKLVQENPD